MPLHYLLERLRSEGFLVGTDAHVRVNRLLRLEACWDQRRLQAALRAVLATSPEESARFDRVFVEAFGEADRRNAPGQEDRARAIVPTPIARDTSRRRRSRRRWIDIAVLSAVAAVAIGGDRFEPEQERQAPEETAVEERAPQPAQMVLPAGRIVLDHDAIAKGSVLIGLACVLFAVALIIEWRRHRSRKRYWPGPWNLRLRAPKTSRWYTEEDIDCAAAVLAPARVEGSHELDVVTSIDATAAAGGLPVLRFATRRRYPRVAFVVDRAGSAAGWFPIFHELGRRLELSGVALGRYEYESHLDEVFPSGSPSASVTLAELAEEHEAIVVVGDGSGARDPLTRLRSDWIDQLGRFADRLWINPVPRGERPEAARELEEEIPVVDPGVLLGRSPEPESDMGLPPIVRSAPGCAASQSVLMEYLGPAFSALQAAVVTGPPDPEMAIWAATQMRTRPGQRYLLRLLSLPWFRERSWPQALVGAIRAGLQRAPEQASIARELQARVLETNEPPSESLAHLRWRLNRALAHVGGEQVTSALRRELRSSPLADDAHSDLVAHQERGLRARDVPTLAAIAMVLLAGGGWVLREPYVFEEYEKIAVPEDRTPAASEPDTSTEREPMVGKVATPEGAARALTTAAARVGFDPTLDCSQLRHRIKPPRVRMGAVTTNGRLPPEAISRIIRQNYGRFRACYEVGLRANPNLQGRVAVRFTVGRDGSVSNVANAGSDIADPAVVECVVRAFYALSFPQPEGGIVNVVYPLMFGSTIVGRSNVPSVGSKRARDGVEVVESEPKPSGSADPDAPFTSDGIAEGGPISIEGGPEPLSPSRSRIDNHLDLLRTMPEVPGGLLERERLRREAAEAEQRKAELNAKRALVGLPPCP